MGHPELGSPDVRNRALEDRLFTGAIQMSVGILDGMHGTVRPADFMTPDLLCVWTDPDTAMEVVGRSLGIFDDRVSNPTKVLSTDSPLRNALSNVLLSLVEGGVLEMRPCGGGRHAFRWRDDIASTAVSSHEKTPAPLEPVAVDVASPRTERSRHWPRLLAPAAPLFFPAASCILAILVFVLLDHAFALVIAGALMLVGVIGLARRVPFAGFWTVGLVVAAALLRFS
jgi:hypothetical protein